MKEMTDQLMIEAQQLAQSGQSAAAIQTCTLVLQLAPGRPDASLLLGHLYVQSGAGAQAEATLLEALRLHPRHPHLLLNLGTICATSGQLDAANTLYDQALAANPGWDEAWNAKGNLYTRAAQSAEAIACYDQALRSNPQRPDTLYSRATALLRMREFDASMKDYQQALQMQPTLAPAWYGLAVALVQTGQLPRAVKALDRLAALDVRMGQVLGMRLHTRMKMCDWDGIESDLAQLALRVTAGADLCAPFESLTLWDDPALQLHCARVHGASVASRTARVHLEHADSGKIRIGYFSADLHEHATAYLIAGLLEHHDRSRFHVTAFSFQAVRDTMRTRLEKAVDAWVELGGQTDTQAVALARSAKLDIAVDLKGYTELARAGLFAAGVAPVQVSYLGFPGTMGVDFIDYVLADHCLVPPGEQRHFVEQVVYLPHSYQPTDNRRAVASERATRAQAGLPEQGFVFCCFNNNFKITPIVFACWVRILKAIPHSVLWLLADNIHARDHLLQTAARLGLEHGRLVFASRIGVEHHLARLSLADLFLDTLPYNAHTSASDALWVGLPVLTCQGRSFAARVASSLLQAVGLPELITTGMEDYEALAIALASDGPRLQALRQRLAANRDTQPLFDTARLTRHIESAYQTMTEHSRAGRSPASFSVPA